MLLVLAILVLMITVLGTVLVSFANMMADAQGNGFSWKSSGLGFAVSGGLFAAWWFWGGSAVTW